MRALINGDVGKLGRFHSVKSLIALTISYGNNVRKGKDQRKQKRRPKRHKMKMEEEGDQEREKRGGKGAPAFWEDCEI